MLWVAKEKAKVGEVRAKHHQFRHRSFSDVHSIAAKEGVGGRTGAFLMELGGGGSFDLPAVWGGKNKEAGLPGVGRKIPV